MCRGLPNIAAEESKIHSQIVVPAAILTAFLWRSPTPPTDWPRGPSGSASHH